jgi:O-antigen ligase
MELKRVDSVIIKILYLLATGIIVSQVLGLDQVTSVLFLLTFPLTVLLWVRSVRKKLDSTDILVLLTAVLAIVSLLLNALVTGTKLSFDYLKKLIMFIMSLLFLQTANKVRVEQNMIRFINGIVDVITFFLIAMYIVEGQEMYMLNGRLTPYLTFGFSNPNLTGLFMICLYMLEIYRLFTKEKIWLKVIHIIMAIFLAWFVVASQSRNCLLVLVLYTAVCVWLIFRGKRNMRIGKTVSVAMAILPAVFVLLYMAVVNTEWIAHAFSFLVDEGKQLDSRTKIWACALEYISSSPIIGAYSQLSHGTGVGHMHNSHLDVAASYGIPVMCLLCVILQRHLHQNGRSYSNKRDYIYILGFACAIMLGIGEAALFSGGLAIHLFVGTFLLLANLFDRERVSV